MDVVGFEVATQNLLVPPMPQVSSTAQQPPPKIEAHWKLLDAEHGRPQQEVVGIGVPLWVMVTLHKIRDGGQGFKHWIPMVQQFAWKLASR